MGGGAVTSAGQGMTVCKSRIAHCHFYLQDCPASAGLCKAGVRGEIIRSKDWSKHTLNSVSLRIPNCPVRQVLSLAHCTDEERHKDVK